MPPKTRRSWSSSSVARSRCCSSSSRCRMTLQPLAAPSRGCCRKHCGRNCGRFGRSPPPPPPLGLVRQDTSRQAAVQLVESVQAKCCDHDNADAKLAAPDLPLAATSGGGGRGGRGRSATAWSGATACAMSPLATQRLAEEMEVSSVPLCTLAPANPGQDDKGSIRAKRFPGRRR